MVKIAEAIKPTSLTTIDPTKLIQSSTELLGEDAWWCLYGPPCHGKTIAAASAARNFPAIPNKGPVVKLEGILYLQADRSGTDSLRSLGLEANVVNISKYTTVSSIRAVINATAELVRSTGIETLIVDTLSSLDKAMLADLTPKFDSGKKFGLYQTLLTEHAETLKTFRSLPCSVVFLCHSKAKAIFKEGEFAEITQAKELATETPGEFTVKMDLSGQMHDYIKAQCSVVMPVVAEKIGNRDPDYYLYPNGYTGFESKNRYKCFANKEKPNLYEMFQRVKSQKEAA